MAKKPIDFRKTLWWNAPAYFDRWRIFPRVFISMYIYLLYEVVTWFMSLSDPNMEQSALVSVIVGAGAAWFGLYLNGRAAAPSDPPRIERDRDSREDEIPSLDDFE